MKKNFITFFSQVKFGSVTQTMEKLFSKVFAGIKEKLLLSQTHNFFQMMRKSDLIV